jgi:putative phage-type endonuclease
MKNTQSTINMTRDEWLDARRKGLGGSDAGAILGLSKWSTPLDVYLDKIGEKPPQDESEPMHWGNVLEPLVAEEYARRSGNKVRRNNRILSHAKHPFIKANLDREIVGKNGILEVKTARYADGWGEVGTDVIPDSYLAQVTHYMAVTDNQFADVAVLIGGSDFRIYHIKRDEELVEMMIEREVAFWNDHVLARIAPDPINVSDTANRWPNDNGESIVASKIPAQQVASLRAIKAKIKDLNSQAKGLEVEIKKEMAEASLLLDADGHPLASWKEKLSKRLDTKRFKAEQADVWQKYAVESSSRTFLIK